MSEPKKKSRVEWDAEFEASLEGKRFTEKEKEDMRAVRKFALAILDGEKWAEDLCEKVIEKMPIPIQAKDLGMKEVHCPECDSTNTFMLDSTPERTINACLNCDHKWKEE